MGYKSPNRVDDQMAAVPMKTKPRRTWLQISLRSFLVLFTILCLWMAVLSSRARHQRSAVDALARAGVTVDYRHQRDDKGSLVNNPVPPGPKWLRELVGTEYFDQVDSVLFPLTDDPDSTDQALEHIASFHEIRFVNLRDAAVSDKGLANLQNLTQLEGLDLPVTYVQARRRITDDGISHLANLTKLRAVDFHESQVTDTGLEKLQNLQALRVLGLGRTQITDSGLVYVGKLRSLVFLDLWKTSVTDEGVAHLRGLSNLEQLVLADTLVTGKSIEYLVDMTKLYNLALSGCDITDAAIPVLTQLSGLRLLQIERTNITEEGVGTLEQALPGCKVSY